MVNKNPHYTGLQTYTIPFEKGSLINNTMVPYTPNQNMAGTSQKQNVANWQNRIPDLIRPRPENMVLQNNFEPFWVPPPKQVFNLETVAKRRSQDKSATW